MKPSRTLIALFSIGLAMTAGCTTANAGLDPIAAPQISPYRLGAGDEVRITVYGFDQMTNSYAVSDTGTISLPLLPPLAVGGRTVAEVEQSVGAALKAKELVNDPSVSAQVVKYRPFFILGEVQRPGQYPFVPGMSVLTAVTIAGGYTFRAEKKNATITRQSGNAVIKGSGDQTALIAPGDTILIRESWF